jgi:hypothetical protein
MWGGLAGGSLVVMRVPVRSENEAFRLTVAGVVAIVTAVAVGGLTQAWIGVGVLAAMALVAAMVYVRSADPDRRTPLHDAALAEHPHGPSAEERHVLVIANQALEGQELRDRLTGVEGKRVEIDVLAPLMLSHVHFGVSDIDREREQAHERLERSLAWAREQGIVARGVVGDPSATSTIEDQLRDFGADEVLVVSHPPGEENWQERETLQRLRRELEVPVRQVTLATRARGGSDENGR